MKGSEYMIEKLANENRIKKLDQNKITGYKQNVSPFIESVANSKESGTIISVMSTR